MCWRRAAARSCTRSWRADLPIVVVLVDRPVRCDRRRPSAAGVPVEVVERTSFGRDFDRVAYTHEVVDALARHDVDLIAMAGFGTILEKPIHDAFPDRIVNTHPALLPAFKGWHAVQGRARRRSEGDGLHGAHRAARGRRRPDPRPGGGARPDDDTVDDAARADQRSGATSLPGGAPARSPRTTPDRRALLSVWDKAGLVDFARGLHDLGWELVSSGGTATRDRRGRHPRGARSSRSPGSPRCSTTASSRCTRRCTAASSPTAARRRTSPTSSSTASRRSTWW